jgi:hypothetical protein
MLTSLDKWLDAEPGLGAVRVSTPWIAGGLEFDLGRPPESLKFDLRTVLATDDLSPAGVTELCETLKVGYIPPYSDEADHWSPVTARLLIWRGQEVEWHRTLGRECLECNGAPDCELCRGRGWLWCGWRADRPVTAVILLATDPIPVERVREARDACAEAGVQFVIASFDYAFTKAEFGGVLRHDGQTLDGRDLSRLELT